MDESSVQVTKRCTKCGEEKPATTEFFHTSSGRPGLRPSCIACAALAGKRRYESRRGELLPSAYAQRFWESVRRGAKEDCWEWTKACGNGGYGAFCQRCAHRVAWEFTFGKIEGGLHVLHRCDNRKCCNPWHLFLGTNADNVADMMAKQRQHRGERTGGAFLDEARVREIRRLRESGVQLAAIGQLFGIKVEHVHSIVKRRIWKHVG